MLYTKIAVVVHDGLWEFTPLAIFTMLPLLKRLTLPALTLCLKTLFYYDCLCHQELENIAHDGRGGFKELEQDGMGQTLRLL